MPALTKMQILSGVRKRQTVAVPELGGDVTLQRMGAMDYWRMKRVGRDIDWEDPVAAFEFTLEYLALSIVDPDTGDPMFLSRADDGETWVFSPEDRLALSGLDPDVVDRLFGEALVLHGVKREAMEDVVKNSDGTSSCDGGSDSHGCAATRTPTTCSPS